jgi:hypothetical protein
MYMLGYTLILGVWGPARPCGRRYVEWKSRGVFGVVSTCPLFAVRAFNPHIWFIVPVSAFREDGASRRAQKSDTAVQYCTVRRRARPYKQVS